MNAKRRALKHYLISLRMNSGHLHGYLITDDKRCVSHALDQMMNVAEGMGGFFPMILTTELDTGADLVREIISNVSDEAREALKTYKDYHLSVFWMSADHADNSRLMELH